MKQTEITVQVKESEADLIKKLTEGGFNFERSFEMCDHYFTHIKDYKKASYSDLIKNSVLIRTIIDEKTISKIVYKDKQIDCDGNVISEQKLSAKIDNAENAVKLFLSAGFYLWSTVKNYSKVFKNGEIELCVQNISNLGLFIELEEYPSISTKNNKEKFEILKQTIINLNIVTDSDFSAKKPYMILQKIIKGE